MTATPSTGALANALRRYADEIDQLGAPAPKSVMIHMAWEPHEAQRDAVRAFLQSAGMDFEVSSGNLGDQVVRKFGPLTVTLMLKAGVVTTTARVVAEEVRVPSNAEILGSLYGVGR